MCNNVLRNDTCAVSNKLTGLFTGGQTDWGAVAVRDYWDNRKAPWVRDCKDNLMTPDVGWAGLMDYRWVQACNITAVLCVEANK